MHPYQLDAERGNYRLQEGKLVDVFIKACGVARDGAVAKAAKGWKKPGVKGVGIFARVMEEVSLEDCMLVIDLHLTLDGVGGGLRGSLWCAAATL